MMASRNSGGPIAESGFSLIEIAIVLVIVSLIVGGALGPLSGQIENSRRDHTTQTLDNVATSLLGFAMASGRLPCPDVDGDGIEDPVSGAGGCNDDEGTLPFVTLSMEVDDAWHQNISYFVDEDYADDIDGTGCGSATPGVSFEICSQGDITVLDAAVSGNVVAQNLPVVLLSRGKHWIDDRSDDERENTDNDRDLVHRTYSGVDGAEYDDIVRWISAPYITAKMVDSGALGS